MKALTRGISVAVVVGLLLTAAPMTAQAAPAPAKISIDSVSVVEGNAGSKALTFTLTLQGTRSKSAKVNFATADGTATVSGGDYVGRTGTVSFTGGSRQSVSVFVNGDLLDEGAAETFFVNLSNPVGATLQTSKGTGTITDDDAPPALSIADAAVGEGNTGTTPATFAVTLTAPSASPVSVNYATADGTAKVSDTDYVAVPPTAVLFAPGQTVKNVSVQVVGDTKSEPNQTFTVALSSPVNATLADGNGVGTIVDDEAVPAVSIGDQSVLEGDSGTVNASFEVKLSHSSDSAISVAWASADGTALQPGDYAAAGGSVNFAAGEDTKTVTVPVKGDAIDELDERFAVSLSAPSGANIADGAGSGTIQDDDLPANVSVGDASVTEADSGTTIASVQISLSADHEGDIVVGYETLDGSATAVSDYNLLSDTLTFSAGETSKTVDVQVVGDTLAELDEDFGVHVSSIQGAAAGDLDGRVTIAEDEDRVASYTHLLAAKKSGKIVASGWLDPAHTGVNMVVTLLKKKGGRFVRVTRKQALLGSGIDLNSDGVLDSKFGATFSNPKGTTKCRVVASFAGDLDHFASKARKTFAC
jgi:Calx-beta domain